MKQIEEIMQEKVNKQVHLINLFNRIKTVEDLEKLLSQTRKECYDEMREMINTNQKGTFTDDGGNDCWYIDSLNKALDEKEGK
jgi:ABC-type bacteriocin/lantibiotic exporter with double-glycine peptidase domain